MTTPEMKTLYDSLLSGHVGIVGATGSGKTFCAKGIAEYLLENHSRVCVIDPTSAWFGIKVRPDKVTPAFPLVIFGGEHADVPIRPGQGDEIAGIVGTTDISSIIDTVQMTVDDRTRFLTDFADALFRLNKGTLHLFIDEADVVMPQRGGNGDKRAGRMLMAANNLMARGRSRGLQITIISQRPAKLHKDSLSQVDTLIAMKLKAPQDRNAIKGWAMDSISKEVMDKLMEKLPSLPKGTGWVLDTEGQMTERQFPMISTFDSSNTPKESSIGVEAAMNVAQIKKRLGIIPVKNDDKPLPSEPVHSTSMKNDDKKFDDTISVSQIMERIEALAVESYEQLRDKKKRIPKPREVRRIILKAAVKGSK